MLHEISVVWVCFRGSARESNPQSRTTRLALNRLTLKRTYTRLKTCDMWFVAQKKQKHFRSNANNEYSYQPAHRHSLIWDPPLSAYQSVSHFLFENIERCNSQIRLRGCACWSGTTLSDRIYPKYLFSHDLTCIRLFTYVCVFCIHVDPCIVWFEVIDWQAGEL